MAFYRAALPACYSEGTEAYPVRPTQIVRSASGSPIRRAMRSESYREFRVTFDVRRRNDVHDIIAHYEVMQGPLHSFPMRDKFDFRSGRPEDPITALDSNIGTGNGSLVLFQTKKTYRRTLLDGVTQIATDRTVKVIKANSMTVAVNGSVLNEGSDWSVNLDTGVITFSVAPANGAVVTAGYEFYVPVCYGPSNPIQTLASVQGSGSIASIILYEVDV